MVSFPQVSPPKLYMNFSSPPYVSHAFNSKNVYMKFYGNPSTGSQYWEIYEQTAQ
jgi:hypothetical protein